MVAFIIFGGFALVRRIGRVFLIPVLAARSASAGAMWRRADNGSLPRRCPHGVHHREYSNRLTRTTLPRRCPHGVHPPLITSRTAQQGLCHGAVRTECIPHICVFARKGQDLCHGAVRTECIPSARARASAQRSFATALSARSASPCITTTYSLQSALPRRCPHGVHLQKQTNFVCIMRRELVDSFSGTAKSSCADYFPILFCCQSDLYHHDRQPRTGNRPVLLCEQHSHFLCIRPSH